MEIIMHGCLGVLIGLLSCSIADYFKLRAELKEFNELEQD